MPRHHNSPQRIAEAALRLLEKKGAGGVTMRHVARTAGITPMAIYNHFPNRETLLKRVTDGEFQRLLQFSAGRLRTGRLDSPLLNLLDGYLDYALARPNIFDYVFSKPRSDARRFPVDFRERRSPTLNLIADTVTAEMKAGRLRKDDPWEVAMALWTQAHGCVTLYRAQRFTLSTARFRAFYRRSLRRLLRGLES